MASRKAALKQTFYIVATIVVILLIAKYISANWAEFSKLEVDQPIYVPALLLFSAINLLVYGKGLDVILRTFSVHLSLYETLKIVSLARLLNQVVPGKVGVAARAHYLKKQHQLPYTHYASSFLASNMLMHCINAMVGLIALLFLPLGDGALSLGLVLGAVLAFFLGVFTFKPEIENVHHRNRIIRYLKRTVDGWSQIRKQRQTLSATIFWMSMYVLSQALVFVASFKMLGIDIGLWEAAFISSVTLLGSFIGFTPGALGIAEALVVAAAVSLGVAAPIAFAAAILRRLSGLLVAGVGTLLTLRTRSKPR